MRIRAVRPDFWSDETLGHLPDPVRLFYIGLWCVSDDAGWFEYHAAQLGAALYPYRPVRSRERDIERYMVALVELERIVLYPCGCGYIPTMARHQALGGRPSYAIRDKHKKHDVRTNTDASVPLRTAEAVEIRGDKNRGGAGGDWAEKVEAMRVRSHEA
jgi:hypothetical protein